MLGALFLNGRGGSHGVVLVGLVAEGGVWRVMLDNFPRDKGHLILFRVEFGTCCRHYIGHFPFRVLLSCGTCWLLLRSACALELGIGKG